GSPNQRLSVHTIYLTMEEKLPYYRTTEVDWKHSVRHQLSLNRLFERQQRLSNGRGQGSYWKVN
ncbi:fork head domain-containing protein, partial [Mycena leptocephala]